MFFTSADAFYLIGPIITRRNVITTPLPTTTRAGISRHLNVSIYLPRTASFCVVDSSRSLTQSHPKHAYYRRKKPRVRNLSANSIYETYSKPDLVSHGFLYVWIRSYESDAGFAKPQNYLQTRFRLGCVSWPHASYIFTFFPKARICMTWKTAFRNP